MFGVAMKTVWLVDDDASIRFVLEKALERSGFNVESFANAQDVLNALKFSQPTVLVSDVKMPGMDGMALLELIAEQNPGLPVIIMTAHSDLDSAVNAFQKGAFEYLAKPFDLNEAVALVESAFRANSTKKTKRKQAPPKSAHIIGEAPAMQEVFRAIGKLSASSMSVLINGESGTGKELVASALHNHSPRKENQFIALNMAAIPKELVESELFGHEKGAFTGADTVRKGRFEQANGGTLFLDEIGDMPLNLQVKLLRVLQEKTIRPVGFQEEIPIDVRIVSATHKNLPEAIKNQQFREDLYYRLNVVNLKLPPLCERREDISLLAQYFSASIAERMNQNEKHFANDAMHALVRYDWPGNIRQLQNVVEQVVALTPGEVISAHLVLAALDSNEKSVEPLSLNDAKKEFERDYVINTLKMAGGNVAEGAKLAKRNRSDFYKLIKKHNIDVDSLA